MIDPEPNSVEIWDAIINLMIASVSRLFNLLKNIIRQVISVNLAASFYTYIRIPTVFATSSIIANANKDNINSNYCYNSIIGKRFDIMPFTFWVIKY